jgi:site-specific recombinase XerC
METVLAANPAPAARRDRVLFAFLLGTGARLGSTVALDVADLDLSAGTATLRELMGGGFVGAQIPRGANAITAIPVSVSATPSTSQRSGFVCSTHHIQRTATET